jgi:hypothetical protein
MNWRKLNFAIHRDLGYLCIGLTLLYAISGVAVNHITPNFNPSYKIVKEQTKVAPAPQDIAPDMNFVQKVLKDIEEFGRFKNVVMLDPDNMRIFVEGNTIDVQLSTGNVQQEKVSRRPILFELNYLHLNKPKGLWTYFADVYAVFLGLLAITGLLMLKGKHFVRGIVLTVTGVVVPVIFLLYLL